HETFTRQLMLAHYRCGEPGAALEVFQRVGEPSTALCALHSRVLAEDPRLELTDPGAGRARLIVGGRILGLGASRPPTPRREATNDVAVTGDPLMSRLHALLECIGGAWVLSDDGLSSNGTFCNDERLRRRRLEDGDVIRMGRTLLVFRDGDAHAANAITRSG